MAKDEWGMNRLNRAELDRIPKQSKATQRACKHRWELVGDVTEYTLGGWTEACVKCGAFRRELPRSGETLYSFESGTKAELEKLDRDRNWHDRKR